MLLFYLQYNKGAGGSRQGQLTGSGGNRRLLLASLHNRDFVVWTGHFVSLLSLIGLQKNGIKHCIQLLAKKMEVSIFHLQKNCCLEIMVSSVSMTEVQVKILSGQLFMI